MITIKVDTINLDKVLAKIKDLPKNVRNQVATTGMKKCCNIFKETMAAKAPKRKRAWGGRLKKNIRILIKDVAWDAIEGATVSMPFYARFVEFGHKKVRRIPGATGSVKKRYEAFGDVAPRPFVSQTFEADKAKIEQVMAQEIAKALKKYGVST